MYVTQSEYSSFYGAIDSAQFNRLAWEASRFMDYMTTGVDGVQKLKLYMPSDNEDIRMCCAKLISLMQTIEQAEGYIVREDGTVTSKAVSSISSGSESISFANSGSSASAISDPVARKSLLASTVKAYLGGLVDSNGVNLLYMGAYPDV